jgi:hypothetical protein
LISSKDDLVSQLSPLREEDFLLRGEISAEGGGFLLRGEDFLLRGEDFWLRGGGFSAEYQKSTLCPILMKLCMVIPMDMPNNRKMHKTRY